MESIPLLRDIVVLFAASIVVLVVFYRIGLPIIIGFLVTGILIGPYGLRLVTNVESIELLAQIGIVLLLFTIGMELSQASIKRVGREVIGVGSFQIIVTALLTIIIANLLKVSFPVSILIGFVIAHSSTAIILKILDDRGEIDSPHGRLALSICIVQDLAVIPMVIILQALGGAQVLTFTYIAKTILYAVLSIALVMVLSYIFAPRLIHQVVKLRSREIFILTILFVCLGIAWFTSKLGLSVALGAFIAGIVISESEYSHQIAAEILPFKDVFTSLFFISIGMLLELNYFIANVHKIIPIAMGIIVFKSFIIIAGGQILRYPLRMVIIAGLGLSNIGEFSFLLMKIGETYNLISKDLYQTLLASSIITMAGTPFIFQKSQIVALKIAGIFGIRESKGSDLSRKVSLKDHVIIVGYGLNGQNLAKVLKDGGIHYIIMDIDINRIRKAKKDGHRVVFGDASHPEVMRKIGIEDARMAVIAISDPVTSRRAVRICREINPSVYIIVRTRYTEEVQELYKLGANQVIAEEFETSIEIFSRVLGEYHIPANIIQNQIDLVRQEGYAMFRTPSIARERIMELSTILAATISDTFYVKENSPAVNKCISDFGLKEKTGASVIAVIRREKARANPPMDYAIEAGDILVLLGSHAELKMAIDMLEGRIGSA